MYRIFFLLFFSATLAHAQFKNDKVKYSNVFPEDLCKTLEANPGFTLLDVRSQGEFDDTLASSPGLNLGHIKGALHISIAELPQRWKELLPYKDKPLFIYCSHSQRSRRASRMLADSGFTRLFNVDGGLTDFYAQGIAQNPCNRYTVVSSLPYRIISPKQLDEAAKNNRKYFIIDIRSDSSFAGKSLSESINVMGRFAEAVHMPFSNLPELLTKIPAAQPVLIVDEFGSESAKAALLLTQKGIKDVSILLNGMDEWVDYSTELKNKTTMKWSSGTNYQLLPADEFYTIIESKKDYSIIDARTTEEFSNNSKNYWENIGQVKNAVNIPADEIIAGSQMPPRSKPVILYGFNNQEKVYLAAAKLRKAGHEQVAVLRSGIWNLRWSSHNIQGKERLKSLVINVPEQNQ